ncbi:MAG: TonB family protein [Kofleriaceae bacterium]
MADAAPHDLDGAPRRRLAIAAIATLAIHVALALGAGAASEYGAKRGREVAPTVELIDVEVPPPPPPPEPPPPEPTPPEPIAPAPPPPTRAPRVRAAAATTPTAPVEPAPAPAVDEPAPGGAPTVALPSAPPSARGVAVRKGPVSPGRTGRGGEGGGTGTGSGGGSGSKPVSIAMIKTPAMPKGDYSYFDARKDYPAEALQLGVEGKIRVRLTVSDDGRVTSAVLLNKLGHGLDQVALAQAKKLEFVPAKDADGRSVSSFVVWTFTFTLPSP